MSRDNELYAKGKRIGELAEYLVSLASSMRINADDGEFAKAETDLRDIVAAANAIVTKAKQ